MTHEEYKEELQKNVQKLHSEMNKGKEYEPIKVSSKPKKDFFEGYTLH